MVLNEPKLAVNVFRCGFGWSSAQWRGNCLTRLYFGCDSPQEAVAATYEHYLGTMDISEPSSYQQHRLIKNLIAFANGDFIDFRNIKVDTNGLSLFQQKVLSVCRRIPYGETCTYGKIAEQAGNPGAARAVGNVMARNRVPLVIPCHRVIAATGLGGYSGHSGITMKRRLLDLERVGSTC